VTLSNPTLGYTLGRAVGTGTILNDDGTPAPAPRVGVGDATVVGSPGGQQNLIFPVSLSSIAPAPFRVTYSISPGSATHSSSATGGGDFGGALTGTLNFSRSTWLRNVTVPIWPQSGTEGTETFTITLTGVNSAIMRATGTATILGG
jgi:hypothetical protein